MLQLVWKTILQRAAGHEKPKVGDRAVAVIEDVPEEAKKSFPQADLEPTVCRCIGSPKAADGGRDGSLEIRRRTTGNYGSVHKQQ